MATAEQLKALLRSHASRDDERFYSIALQVAAQEARQGHTKLAAEIKGLVEKSQEATLSTVKSNTSPITKQPAGELSGLLDVSFPSTQFTEMVLSETVRARLNKVIHEQRQKDALAAYGLQPCRKLLFTGPPGTGKTMAAAALATELKLPLYTIVLDSLITRFMGETAAKLRLVFDHIKRTRAVYLFDEFDAIGTQRGAQNDVGEIRRVLNSFLLFVEQDVSASIILAATNHPELLDKALHRRFDDIVEFENPNDQQIKVLIENRLAKFRPKNLDWKAVVKIAVGLSSAEITRACEDAAKDAVLHHEAELKTSLLFHALKRRNPAR